MSEPPPTPGLAWTRQEVAGVPLRRLVARAGEVEAGAVEYDGSNRMWVWSSPLAEDAWGWAVDEAGARLALETWLRGWLANFGAFLGEPGPAAKQEPAHPPA